MKKSVKKIISAILVAAASLSLALTSFAESVDSNTSNTVCKPTWVPEMLAPYPDLSEYELVSEESYIDSETGLLFVDRTYIKQDTADIADATVQQSYAPFSKKVEKTRSVYRGSASANYGDLIFTMYVGGTFESKNYEDISVSDVDMHTDIENVIIGTYYKEKKRAHEGDCGANFLFGHKYAYIDYIITVTSPTGNYDVRLYLDVNVMGEESVQG